MTAEPPIAGRRILLTGRVQGEGVRPAIARLARCLGIAGHVRNSSAGVDVVAIGDHPNLDRFIDLLPTALPPIYTVDGQPPFTITTSLLDEMLTSDRFVIAPSQPQPTLVATVPPDRATCPACLDESDNPANRRFRDPFITCTSCGPRFAIIASMPYDRATTSMAHFHPCDACTTEYLNHHDRRFHSQTNVCPKCGPRLHLINPQGTKLASGDAAIIAAATALRSGKIVGLLGIGGFQWLVDATNADRVAELRRRKGRDSKPLAVMTRDITSANDLAITTPLDAALLTDPTNPIVLLPRRPDGLTPNQSNALAAGLDTIGVMLPTTSLHHRLLRLVDRPLVVTSGNVEGEPIAYRSPPTPSIADRILDHDRPVVRPIDDSVVRIIANRAVTIRLARGLAPLTLPIPCPPNRLATLPHIIALGGHQKTAIAIFNGAQGLLGPHIGDLDTEATRGRFVESVDSLCQLYQLRPTLYVHDRHPDYFTTRWAESIVAKQPATPDATPNATPNATDNANPTLRSLAVQHHHAHHAAAAINAGWWDRESLGVIWDGTGYGDDGTIWGGEFLIGGVAGYRRVASLLPIPIVGGETSIRQPWRVAVSLVHRALGNEAAKRLRFDGASEQQIIRIADLLRRADEAGRDTPPSHRPLGGTVAFTTSAGRLFDGIAALTLGIGSNRHEGELAMLLESRCGMTGGVHDASYPLPLIADEPCPRLDWRPLVARVVDDLTAGVATQTIAIRFHHALAHGIAAVSDHHPHLPIVLGGGCFQNRILTESVTALALSAGREIATPSTIPPGDGGLAAGQLAIAIATSLREQTSRR
jgi:hydrogenase maturation protein HypF